MATESYFLTVHGTVQGQYNSCVLCFTSAGVNTNDTNATGQNLILAFQAHLETAWLGMLPTSYTLDMYSARRCTPKPSVVSKLQYQLGAKPGLFGTFTPAFNLCPTVFLVPPMGTKSGGRVFLPCAPAGQISNNLFQPGYIAQIDAFFGSAVSGAAGSGTNWQLSVFSRKLTVASLIQSWSISPGLGFQGRRREPVGAV